MTTKVKQRIIIFHLLVLLLYACVNASSVTVSQSEGNDVPECGTNEAPCKSLQYLFSSNYQLSNNSAILIESGTYNISSLLISQSNITLIGNSYGFFLYSPTSPAPAPAPSPSSSSMNGQLTN